MLREAVKFIDLLAQASLRDNYSEDWISDLSKVLNMFENTILPRTTTSEFYNYIIFELADGTVSSTPLMNLTSIQTHPCYSNPVLKIFINSPRLSTDFLSEPNKKVGSKSGTQSYFPFIFIIKSREDLDALDYINGSKDQRLKKSSNSVKKDFPYFLPFYSDYADLIIKELNNSLNNYDFEKEKPVVVIFYVKPLDPYKEAILKLINKSISKYDGAALSGKCQVCGAHKKILGYPTLGTNLASDKIFLTSPSKKGVPITVCSSCGFKLELFRTILSRYRILPLFVDKKVSELSADALLKYLVSDTSEKRNLYEHIMNEIFSLDSDLPSWEYSHYLISISGKDILLDYIPNFQWHVNLNNVQGYECRIFKDIRTKKDLERAIFALIRNSASRKDIPFDVYMDPSSKANPKQKSLEYRYSKKIYDVVYRDNKVFSKGDVLDFFNELVQNRFYNLIDGKKGIGKFDSLFAKAIQEHIALYWNAGLISDYYAKNGGNMVSIGELRAFFKRLITSPDSASSPSKEEWAFAMGALYRYLLKQSESSDNALHIEPIVNANSTKEAIKRLEELFEKYSYAIKEPWLNKIGAVISNSFVVPDDAKNVSFKELKPYFYAGLADPEAIGMMYAKRGDLDE